MRNPSFLWIIVGIMLLMDIYMFLAIKTVMQSASSRLRTIVTVVYWVFAVITLLTLILFPYLNVDSWPKSVRSYVSSILIGIFFSKLLATVFFALDDIRRGATWLIMKIYRNATPGSGGLAEENISRSVFLSWLGIALGGGLFSTLLYGFRNKYNYQIKRIPLHFDQLPAAFRGLKIIQISDIHSGSLMDKRAVQAGVNKIMKEKADLILFTGDLVNDRAVEMDDYLDVFRQLSAPMGVYSVLGNHDYGDYVRWDSEAAKAANLDQLKQVHEKLGWRLLMNENVVFEKSGEKIALLGVENWSAKGRFPRHGNLRRAHAGTENIPFKMLMSHDPSHWDAEVRTSFSDIALTLSGHTHGMQFGVEIPGFKWSPVQYMYRQWAGLYEEGRQRLYVNRGFGFIGYPGRVGILPEISVFTLV